MKVLTLFALLSLTGCVMDIGYTPVAKPTPAELPLGTKVVASGVTSTNISWKCVQEDVNENLVWLDCLFHNNNSVVKVENEGCIQLSYLTGVTQELVAKSRVVCSGPMPYGSDTDNHVAFQKQPRKELLAICGLDNSFCKLVVTEQKAP
jgi:hypothetical protein